jgi:hypothetical protein
MFHMSTIINKVLKTATKKRTVWGYLDQEQWDYLQTARALLPDRPTLGGWIKRVMMQEAERVINGR